MAFVAGLAEYRKLHPLSVRAMAFARAAQSGCPVGRIALALRVRKGKTKSLALARSQNFGPNSPSYGSTDTGDGSIAITVPTSRKGGLRAALGKRLGLGIVRDPNATRRQNTLT